MSSDVNVLPRAVQESKPPGDTNVNKEKFWNSNPPPIPPVLWLTAMHVKWAIGASQKVPLFGLQLYHLALASQHCVYHLAKEISVDESGSNLDLLLSQVDVLVGLINDLGKSIEAVSHQVAVYEPSEQQEKIDHIFDGLCALKIAGACKVEDSRRAFRKMKFADWVDIEEHKNVSRMQIILTSQQVTSHSDKQRPSSPAPSEGSTDPAQTDREEVNWNTDSESDEILHSHNDENTNPGRKRWPRMKVHSDVYLNPRDLPRLQLLQRIQTEDWFLQQTAERTLSAEEAARIPGAIEGESVLLGFFSKGRPSHSQSVMGGTYASALYYSLIILGSGKSLREKNMDQHVKSYCPVDSGQKRLEDSVTRSSSVPAHPPTNTNLHQYTPAATIFSEEPSKFQTPELSGRASDVESVRLATEGMVSETNDNKLDSLRSGPKSGFRKRLRLMKTSDSPKSSGPRNPSSKSQVYNPVSLDLLAGIAKIEEGSDVLAPLKAACRTMKSILEVIQATEIRQEEWVELAQRLKRYTLVLEEQITMLEPYPSNESAIDESFQRSLVQDLKSLETIYDEFATLKEKWSHSKLGVFKVFNRTKDDKRQIVKLNQDIEEWHSRFMEKLRIFIILRTRFIEVPTKSTLRIMEDDEMSKFDAAALFQLPIVELEQYSVHTTCLPGTRRAVLETIWRWADDNASDKPIFWLCDIGGSGKSTVAMSVIDSCRNRGILGCQFFFSMATSEASTTDKFCSTIARELAQNIPDLAPHIANAVKRHPNIMRSSLEEQFETLISGPLRHRQGCVILVIDAVDECKSAPQRRELVETLATAARNTKNLKIFMTSRPDSIIQLVLGPLSIKAKLEDCLHDIIHKDNVDDVAAYIHQALSGILSEDKIQKLAAKANGLFIWGSTACRMLTSETSWDLPEEIYYRLISTDQRGDIDDVYDLIFERVDPKFHAVMFQMLALLLAAFEPFTPDDLDDILKHNGIRGSVRSLVQNLGSVLVADEGTNLIQFRHPTFLEYLRRCSVPPYVGSTNKVYIDVANAHGQVASWCLNCLTSRTEGLQFNICQIESSFYLNRQIPDLDARVAKFIPRRLRYASSHWSFHVAGTGWNWSGKLIEEFGCIIRSSRVLYWMEILSVTADVSRAISGLQALMRRTGIKEETKNRIFDIGRFMMAFLVPIQESIPHIYISALPFTPGTSKLRTECLNSYQHTLAVTRGLEEGHHGLLMTLRGFKYSVAALAFSPDGSHIASDTGGNAIRLWDIESGQPLGEPLQGHKGPISAVTFSPDGSRIGSASDDQTIRLWDAFSGQPLGRPLRGHKRWVNDLAFSPDGSRMVSASGDMTIRLWDADTGQPIGKPLEGHKDSVSAVEFSPDGSIIISGSWDKTIRLWDAATGQPLGEPIRGHEERINDVAISPDASKIVSGSDDKTIRLWDAETGQPLGEPLLGHNGVVTAVAFSPDGLRIVSASSGSTLELWDVGTSQQLGEPLRGHDSWINAVAFSPDGTRIVSASDDETIRLWDPDSGQPLGELIPGHTEQINDIAISPDGSRIISGSNDRTLRLWSVQSGKHLGGPLRGHSGVVTAVAFSQDGSRVVSASDDKSVRLWDAITGKSLGEPFQGHVESVNTVAFSPDDSKIVSGSSEGVVRVWDAVTGQPVGEAQGHNGPLKTVAFSPDGLRLVSGSTDCTVRIWDVGTGHPIGDALRGHFESVNAVAYSTDGLRFASASDDWTIRLWDATTGQIWGGPLRGHEDSVTSIAFSPDGSTIVSGSSDNTIRYWNVATGQLLGGALRGHSGCVNAVLFSPDGSHVISCSSDKTIRVWDADIVAHITTSKQDSEPAESGSGDPSLGTRLRIRVPGFEKCTLSHDGWVQSSDKHLFWVPPDNRHGLQYRHLLTMPTRSPFRATEIDFTNFQCGTSWTKVRGDAME
ncbi:Vegetative incompatibility protein HET-E-1 [Serendipita indica DSM 11827]|nr:Vegetative incompatibility protein HET-E-1 [Serendipita indica DSM 11827]